MLLRGDEVELWKVTDIAEFLGVPTERVDQLALARAIPGTLGPLGPRTLLGAIGRRGLGGGQLVGRRRPSLATQAIGEAHRNLPTGSSDLHFFNGGSSGVVVLASPLCVPPEGDLTSR